MKRKDFEIVRGDSSTFTWELEGDKTTTNFLFGIKKSNNISDARLVSKTIFTKTYNPTTNTTLIVTTISGNETHDLQYKTLYYDLVNVDGDYTEFTGKISNVFDVISDLDGLNVIDETNRALIIRAKEFQDGQYIKVRKVGDVFDYQGIDDIPMLSLDENGDISFLEAALRNFVPKVNKEIRTIGTLLKKWLKGFFYDLHIEHNLTDETNNVSVAELKTSVDNSHTHSNKALLDSYTQTNSDLQDAVLKKHEHSNKTLLDTYTQTESNLADAVNKKHSHNNQAILDATQESFTTALKSSYDTHISNTNNPHNTTATQVGLGNVTNDAQLKRAGGDYNTFAEKTTPADADKILIEDSVDGYSKKGLSWGNIKAALKTFFDTLYAKLAGLTSGYIPFKSASGELADSPIYTDGTYVGIGTTNPQAKLNVLGNSSGEVFRISSPLAYIAGNGPMMVFSELTDGEQVAGIKGSFARDFNGNFGKLEFLTRTSDALGIETKMTILDDGSVGIMTPSPTIGYKLDVIGDIRCQSLTQYSDINKKENINDLNLGLDFVTKLRPVSFKWKDIEEVKEYEEVEEDVYEEQEVTTTEKVIELVDGKYVQKEIEKVVKQKVQVFDEVDLYDEQGNVIGKHQVARKQKVMKEVVKKQAELHKRKHFGLLAQEVEQIAKDLGIDMKEFGMLKITNYNNPDAEHEYGLDYTQLIPVLIKAIQEIAQIGTQALNELAELKAKVNA